MLLLYSSEIVFYFHQMQIFSLVEFETPSVAASV